MSATSMHDLTCLPTADDCTRQDPGHYESPRQRELLEERWDEWRYGTVRLTDTNHVTTVDFDDAPSVALWSHRYHGRIFLLAGTQVALHEPSQLMLVKKVLATRVSVLVLGAPDEVRLPTEWQHMKPAVPAPLSPPDLTREELSALFRRLTQSARGS